MNTTIKPPSSLIAGVLSLWLICTVNATDGTWVGNGNQTYGNAFWGGVANWSGTVVADGVGASAFFGNSFTNGYTCGVNTNRTIGNITFTDPANANDLILQINASNTLTLAVNSGAPSINVTQAGRSISINPIVLGSAGLAKNGPGNLTLANANSYSGLTTINSGTLTLANSLAMQNSVIDAANSTSGDAANGLKTTVATLTLGGLSGTKNLADLLTTSSGAYNTLTGLTLNPGIGVTTSYSGAIADGATGMMLTLSGSGTQILSGSNSYSGNTVVQAGVMQLGASTALPANSMVILAGATLDLHGYGATVGSLSVTGSNAVIDFGAAGSNTLRFNNGANAGWTGYLSVKNFDPATDHLYFGSSAAGINGNDSSMVFMNPVGLAPGNYAISVAADGAVTPGTQIINPFTNGTWGLDGSGLWGNSGNWSGGIVADGSGATAVFNIINITS